MSFPGVSFDVLLDISVDTQKTVAFEIPDWARTGKVYVPAVNANGAIAFEVIMPEDNTAASTILPSADTNWKQVADSAESTQVAASGTEDLWIDITEYIRGWPKGTYGRFTVGDVQVADVTFKVSFRGA